MVGLSDVDRGAVERPAANARGRRRRPHRPLAGRRAAARSPTSSSAPTATSCTWSSTRRRATATASRWRSWSSTTAGAAPVWSRRSSGSSPTAAASPPAPGRSTCIRTPCASGSSASSASPSWTFRSEDLLSLELALKLVRLHDVRAEASEQAMAARRRRRAVRLIASQIQKIPKPSDVQQEHEQHPPGLPEELQVRLLPELVPGQVAHDQEGSDQDRRRLRR